MAAPPADLAAVCASGEAAARRCVLSKVDRSLVRSLDIVVSAEKGKGKDNGKGKDFSVDVSIDLDPVVDIDVEALADEAAGAALSEIDLKMKGQKA